MMSLADKTASDVKVTRQLAIPEAIASSPFGPLLLETIQETEAKKKLAVPWTLDEPYSQSYFVFNATTQVWGPRTPGQLTKAGHGTNPESHGAPLSDPIDRLALYSWNIDMMLPFPEARTSTALNHIHALAKELPSTTAVVILIQECTVSHLDAIAKSEWIRGRFSITDIDSSNWATGHFGTTILVDRRLPITSCFRVHFAQTFLDRDAYFVDVVVSAAPVGRNDSQVIRLCNVHLESFDWETPLRPAQMRIVAKHIREDGISGSVVAGDFNSTQTYDRTFHTEHGLKDAFLEVGGQGDAEDGFTWGLQSPQVMKGDDGPARLDKVMYRGGGLKLRRFEVFGRDVELSDDSQRAELVRAGCEKPWVTDHLGVMAEFEVTTT